MTTQPTTKVTYQSLADMSGSTVQEVKDLLKSYNLSPENLTKVQIDSIKSELTRGIQINTPSQATPHKVPMVLKGDAPKVTLPVSTGEVDLEFMTIEEIIQYERDQDEALQKQKLIASIKFKNQELIDLRDKNLSSTLENESAEASYKMRLESQPQLLALSIDTARTIQANNLKRDITALQDIQDSADNTPTAFEMRSYSSKKSQRQGENRVTMILNSTEDLVPTMRISGSPEKQVQTVEI